MAGRASRLSRKDLEFIADDIGRDLIAVMNPKDVVEGLDMEKQRRLLALFSPKDRLADLSIEELLKGISPEKQKALLDSLLKLYSAPSPDEKQTNGNSKH